MVAKILSLNIGGPTDLVWADRAIRSSMIKHPVVGPLIVHCDRIEGNIFASPEHHGSADAILYLYGLTSAQKFMQELGLAETYQPGTLGETLSLDEFDESQVSVGDIFQIGEVLAQATYPRIPCSKVNYRMQNENAMAALQACGVSGVYFRILKPGKIYLNDQVQRTKISPHPVMIADLYQKMMRKVKPTLSEIELYLANGAFPHKTQEKFKKLLAETS